MRFIIALMLAGAVVAQTVDSTKKPLVVNPSEIEGKTKTIYGIDGRPINQGLETKGRHPVSGEKKLAGTGVDTITINTAVDGDRNDVSFIDHNTYHGIAWSLDGSNGKTYRIVPLSGNRFEIRSSDSTDTATVKFFLEGE